MLKEEEQVALKRDGTVPPLAFGQTLDSVCRIRKPWIWLQTSLPTNWEAASARPSCSVMKCNLPPCPVRPRSYTPNQNQRSSEPSSKSESQMIPGAHWGPWLNPSACSFSGSGALLQAVQ